jgi:hypothetical protein
MTKQKITQLKLKGVQLLDVFTIVIVTRSRTRCPRYVERILTQHKFHTVERQLVHVYSKKE